MSLKEKLEESRRWQIRELATDAIRQLECIPYDGDDDEDVAVDD